MVVFKRRRGDYDTIVVTAESSGSVNPVGHDPPRPVRPRGEPVNDFVATCVADGCTSASGQDYLCQACTVDLATMLRELAFSVNGRGERRPGLLEDLDDTVFKMDNVGPRGGGSRKGHEVPLPIRMDASDLKSQARTMIATWARDMAGTYPFLEPTYKTHAEAAEWIARIPGLLAEHPAAQQIMADVKDIVTRIRRMIDQAPARTYLGTCGAVIEGVECTDGVYAIGNRDYGRCRTCGNEFDRKDRRDWMLASIDDELAHVEQLAAMVTKLGEPVSSRTILRWVKDGKLTVQKIEGVRKLYRVGDVLAILHESKGDQKEQAA